jgi:hypothetical protein
MAADDLDHEEEWRRQWVFFEITPRGLVDFDLPNSHYRASFLATRDVWESPLLTRRERFEAYDALNALSAAFKSLLKEH